MGGALSLVALLAGSAAAQAFLPDAFFRARSTLSGTRQSSLDRAEAGRKADEAEFRSWGVEDPRFIFLTVKGKECAGPECQRMRAALAEALRGVPRFLRASDVQAFFWDDPGPGDAPEGHADGKMVRVRASSERLRQVLVHELAHHFDEHNGKVSGAFLNIRCARQPLYGELDALWKHIREINKGRTGSRPAVDEHVRSELRRLRVPRRDDDDVHLTADYYEYWAGSVELYWLHTGDRKALRPYLTDQELDFLLKVFGRPQSS